MNLDATVKDNLRAIAKRLDREVENLVIIVLDRPRHAELIQQIREAGARIRLIGDGDLSAGISVALRGTRGTCRDGNWRSTGRGTDRRSPEMPER